MSAAIEPGMWVERTRTANGLRAGSIWCVAEVGPGLLPGHHPGCELCWDESNPGLRLVGDPPPPDARLRCACGFRPIYRPREHAFDHLLTDLPADLDALEPALAAPRGRAPRQAHPAFREEQ